MSNSSCMTLPLSLLESQIWLRIHGKGCLWATPLRMVQLRQDALHISLFGTGIHSSVRVREKVKGPGKSSAF